MGGARWFFSLLPGAAACLGRIPAVLPTTAVPASVYMLVLVRVRILGNAMVSSCQL